VHVLPHGKVIKTLPRTHTKDVRYLKLGKKKKSRRAADARRRALQAAQQAEGEAGTAS